MFQARTPGVPGNSKRTAKNLQLILFVGEYNAAVRCDVSVDRVCVDECVRQTPRTRPEIRILHSLYIVPRFSVGRDAVSPVNSTLSCIVRRQGQIQVAIVSF